MAILTTHTVVGNIGSIYKMRTVGKDNREVIDFTVAATPRKKVGDDWVDGETYWLNVTVWGKLAANVEKSFKAGDRVVVIGRMDMKPGYKNKDEVEVPARPILIADFAGLEVGYHPAKSERVSRSSDSSSKPSSDSAPASKKTSSKKDDDLDLGFGDDDDLDVGF